MARKPKKPETIKDVLANIKKQIPKAPTIESDDKLATGGRVGGGGGGGRRKGKTAKTDAEIKEMVGAEKYKEKATPAAQMKSRAKNAAYMRNYRARKRGA